MSNFQRKAILDNFKPGSYVLSRDVENPHPDRRKVRDWTAAPTWKKGDRFLLRHRFVDKRDDGTNIYCAELSMLGGGYYYFLDTEDGFTALLDALAPAEETVASYLALHHWDHSTHIILQKLVDVQIIKIDDIAEAIKSIHEDWDREEKEREAQKKS